MTACECFISSECDTVLDIADQNSLYYLAGYVVASVQRNETTCDVCMQSLCVSNDMEQVDCTITQLVHFKEYIAGCLVKSTKDVYDLILLAEQTFRKMQPNLLSLNCNVNQCVVDAVLSVTSHLNFPDCHDIKKK